MNEIEAIERYLVFLMTECGLSVTIHPIEKESLVTFGPLSHFTSHNNSYCAHIKSTPEGWHRCLAQQKKVLKRCKSENGAFCGTCHAGVFEYVYPLFDGDGVIGFVSVSGYAAGKADARIEGAAIRFGYDEQILKKKHALLRLPLDDGERARVDTLLYPLCQMLTLAYLQRNEAERKESLATQICRYVKGHYATYLTTEKICQKFYCSRSHFSHSFKKETGKSFREYLSDVRLEQAKHLLLYSHMSVTEICFSVGFNDANYFSNAFKQKEGISPLAYRQKRKTHEAL